MYVFLKYLLIKYFKRVLKKTKKNMLHVAMKIVNYLNLCFFQSLQRHLDGFKGLYDSILAFEPTGWTHSKRTLSLENLGPKEKKNGIKIYGKNNLH